MIENQQNPRASVQRLLIVIATYNEIENLPRLIEQLALLLPTAKLLVIDDRSPDGTGNWCESARERYPQLAVIHREGKLGLGSAAVLGFQAALQEDFELVATLDADFSHDPARMVDLIEVMHQAKHQETGVVIGSRYVPGGKIVGWPWFRRVVSWTVNGYCRFWLRLTTQDNSGAFRVYRTSALRQIDLRQVRSSGYGYLEEILWHLQRAGVQMFELPITFHDREQGFSKTSLIGGLAVFGQITRLGLSGRLNRASKTKEPHRPSSGT